MPLLQVRDFPDDLYGSLSLAAKNDNRSIAQETIVLIKSALGQREGRIARRKAVLEKLQSLHDENGETFPEPGELIRKDRER